MSKKSKNWKEDGRDFLKKHSAELFKLPGEDMELAECNGVYYYRKKEKTKEVEDA